MLKCVDCGSTFIDGKSVRCSNCGRIYEQKNGIVIAWPKNMDTLAEEEAEHHDEDDSDAAEVHQLNRPRNIFYHEKLWRKMKGLPKGSEILEVGAGTGFDAARLARDYRLTLTDVSPGTLGRLKEKMDQLAGHSGENQNPKGIKELQYIAADGSHLPFADGSFDGVYMVATLHHLPNTQKGISEFARVLKPNGQLYIGIEPNATYFRWIKYFRKWLCRVIRMNPHDGSHADAEMEGFSHRDLKEYFGRSDWKDVEIRPVWFLAGWWHYGAELLFRSLKLKKRLVLPSTLEWVLVYLDEGLFKIPGVKYLAWHWSVSARKL